ncbi:MAG TPA: ABC transporter ATP-binding protein [Mucilaginibacter sp.]|jgi:ABC-type multidrug transport system ATPase subunit|nr:ABC transporter ATP-binding protein [Mucilaginibacter sp.]
MPKLQVDSVELEFGGRKILQDIYLDCKKGEVLGLLGRNGSGKSSLLKIIFGTLTPTHKYVSIDGKVVSAGYLNNRISYLPQHNYLPKGIRISNLAKMLVAPVYWDEFSAYNIYKDHRQKNADQLSGGELRQLEMLMVLYGRADFVLLDEPFTHVTPVQADHFKTVIKQVAKDKGVIVTDHQYDNVLQVSGRIILLTNGCTKPVTGVNDLVTYNYLSGNN